MKCYKCKVYEATKHLEDVGICQKCADTLLVAAMLADITNSTLL